MWYQESICPSRVNKSRLRVALPRHTVLFATLNTFDGKHRHFRLHNSSMCPYNQAIGIQKLLGPQVNERQVRSGPRDSLSFNPVFARNYNSNIRKWHRLPLSYAFPRLQVGPVNSIVVICFKSHSLARGRKDRKDSIFKEIRLLESVLKKIMHSRSD